MICYAENLQELSDFIQDYIDDCDIDELPQLASTLSAYAQMAHAEYEEEMGEADGC